MGNQFKESLSLIRSVEYIRAVKFQIIDQTLQMTFAAYQQITLWKPLSFFFSSSHYAFQLSDLWGTSMEIRNASMWFKKPFFQLVYCNVVMSRLENSVNLLLTNRKSTHSALSSVWALLKHVLPYRSRCILNYFDGSKSDAEMQHCQDFINSWLGKYSHIIIPKHGTLL